MITDALAVGAKVNSTDNDRLTALHLASQEGCVDCVKLLLDHDVDVAALSRHGDTSLSLAARHGQLPPPHTHTTDCSHADYIGVARGALGVRAPPGRRQKIWA